MWIFRQVTYLLPVVLLGRRALVVGTLLLAGAVAVPERVVSLTLTLLAASTAVVVLGRHGDVEINSWWIQLLVDVWLR